MKLKIKINTPKGIATKSWKTVKPILGIGKGKAKYERVHDGRSWRKVKDQQGAGKETDKSRNDSKDAVWV